MPNKVIESSLERVDQAVDLHKREIIAGVRLTSPDRVMYPELGNLNEKCGFQPVERDLETCKSG